MDSNAGTSIAADGHRYPVGEVPVFDGPVRPWRGGRRRPVATVEPTVGVLPAGIPADDRAITSGVVAGSLPAEPVTAEPASPADQTGRSDEIRAALAEAEAADAASRAAAAQADALALARASVAAAEATVAAEAQVDPNLNGEQPGSIADDPEAASPVIGDLDRLTHEQLVDVGEANSFKFHKSAKVDELREEIRVQLADIDELPRRDLVLLADLLGVKHPASATGSKILDLIKNQES